MIITKSGVICQAIADAACVSLKEQVNKKQSEGVLQPGQRTLEKLEWTPETVLAAHEFKSTADLTPLRDLGIDPVPEDSKNIIWAGPIVYGDVLTTPVIYQSSGQGYGVIGMLALGNLTLPEVGGSGHTTIRSGSVAYYRDALPVVYRACGGGRGILFSVKIEESKDKESKDNSQSAQPE